MNSVNYSPTFQGLKNNQPKAKKQKANDGLEGYAGYVVGGAVGSLGSVASLPIMDKMIKVNSKLTPTQTGELFEHAKTALKNAGLEGKTTLHAITDIKQASPMAQGMSKAIDKMNFPKKLANLVKDQIPELGAVRGKNAFFDPLENKIMYNPEKLALAPFHEMGHAMNWNSKLGKIAMIARNPLMGLAGTVMLLAVCAKSKSRAAQEAQQTGKPEKKGFMSFVRDNAGKLSFAAMLPIVAEEGIASYRGAKLAKPLLSPEMFKKMNKANALGFATYALTAVAAGVGAWAAVKIKDKLVANKIAKQEAKAQQANA